MNKERFMAVFIEYNNNINSQSLESTITRSTTWLNQQKTKKQKPYRLFHVLKANLLIFFIILVSKYQRNPKFPTNYWKYKCL